MLNCFGYTGYNRVGLFRGEYRFLSNFYPAKVELDGIVYDNSEAAYQAQKCVTREEREWFRSLEPLDAKNLGAWVYLREDWNEVRFDAMAAVLRAKFTQNPELAALLVGTGDKVLVEGNTWNDRLWGENIYTGEGENHLGRLLMALRKELRDAGVQPVSPLSGQEPALNGQPGWERLLPAEND
ncbi:MAG: NADAR family protein [Clostridia bacterium]|nr:NADAR family protein [Clostridia bacterium]